MNFRRIQSTNGGKPRFFRRHGTRNRGRDPPSAGNEEEEGERGRVSRTDEDEALVGLGAALHAAEQLVHQIQ